MRSREDEGTAAVEAGLLVAGVAALLVGVLMLAGSELEDLLSSALTAVGGA